MSNVLQQEGSARDRGASERPSDAQFFRQMVLIRTFEEHLLQLFAAGKLMGTTHTYSGQEADAVGVLAHLLPQDIVFSSHRCHGHYLARTGDMEGLLAELLGHASGVCGGKGGSQHLCRDNFYTSGVQGGIVPLAVGSALAEKQKRSEAVTVVWLGDGTLGEGSVYEALNMASLWQAPVLFVVENNRYAQTTPVAWAVSGSIRRRAEAFDIPALELETTDPAVIWDAVGPAIRRVRAESVPHFVVLHTYRFGPHSKGDDFRPDEEKSAARRRDPLAIVGGRLEPAERTGIEAEMKALVDATSERLLARMAGR